METKKEILFNSLIILISIIYFIVVAVVISDAPITQGVTILGLGTMLFVLCSFILWKIRCKVDTEYVKFLHTALGVFITSCVFAGISVIVAFSEGCTYLYRIEHTPEVTTAVVKDIVREQKSSNSHLVIEYTPNGQNTMERASITVYGKCYYLKDDCIRIRYNPDNYQMVYSELMTKDKTISDICSSRTNPIIVYNDNQIEE